MDFTNAINNLDQLKSHIQTPFRYDFQYTSQETGTISTLLDFENDWKIFVIVTNHIGNQSVKQLSLLKKDNGETHFNGFWERISYFDVAPVISQDKSMQLFWSMYISKIETLTQNMLTQLTKNGFIDTVNYANNQQLARNSVKKKPADSNIYPWYLRNQTISKQRADIIKNKFGFSVLNWLKNNHWNIVFTDNPFKAKSIYINDLDKKL